MHNRFADLATLGDDGDGEEWQIAVGKKRSPKEPARYDSPTKPVRPGLRYASPSPAKGQMSRMGRNGSLASPFTSVPALCAILPAVHNRTLQLLDQRLRAQKLSAGVLSAALEECERKLQRNGPAVKEYRQMEAKAGANRDYAIAEMDENYQKNRYCDWHDEEDCGYINASHLRSKDHEQPEWDYIAAQGPLFETVPDFWRMVYECGSQMVVMLTRMEEVNIKDEVVNKCEQYWPTVKGDIMPQGNIMVKLDSEDMLMPELCRRQLTLTCLDNDDVLPVTQLQHLTWPDHGMPPNSAALRRILALMRAAREAGPSVPHGGGPPIIHDSAGIGRTGVLVAVDIALRQLRAAKSPGEARSAVDCKAIVQELRRQRMCMVHNQEQFVWLYKVLADEIKALMG